MSSESVHQLSQQVVVGNRKMCGNGIEYRSERANPERIVIGNRDVMFTGNRCRQSNV